MADVESTVAYTMMAAPGEIPSEAPLQAHELGLEYPPRDERNRPMTVAPRPHGMSGGGVWWHPRHDEALVTTPERLRLVAVTTKWNQDASILVATKVEHWLSLVAEDFPDTRTDVEVLLQQ